MSLPSTYKAVVLPQYEHEVELQTLPIPEVQTGTALVKIESSLVNGDMRPIFSKPRNPMFSLPPPFVIGTAGVGRIIKSDTYKPGQLVFMDSMVTSRDDPSHFLVKTIFDAPSPQSKDLSAVFHKRSGYSAEYALVDVENVYPINESAINFDHDYLNNLSRLAVAFGGLKAVGLKPGETIAIAPSSGAFSSAAVALASALGARVLAVGRSESSVAPLAKKFKNVHAVALSGNQDEDVKALTKFGPLNAYMDFTPSNLSSAIYFKTALHALGFGGRVVLSGFIWSEVSIPYGLAVGKNLSVRGKIMYTRAELKELIQLVESGTLRIDDQYSGIKKFALSEFNESMDFAGKTKTFDALPILKN